MTKQLYILPIQTEEIKGLVFEEGNTSKVFIKLVKLFAYNHKVRYPNKSKRDCIDHGVKIAVKQYLDLGIELPNN